VICDNNGNPATPAEAKKIIAERRTVPEDIRKRRRSRKKTGKAPQAATTGPDKRGDLPPATIVAAPHQGSQPHHLTSATTPAPWSRQRAGQHAQNQRRQHQTKTPGPS
jgi:hypothetical protein